MPRKQPLGQRHALVRAKLGHHHHAADLLDVARPARKCSRRRGRAVALGCAARRRKGRPAPVQDGRHLDAQVRDGHKGLEEVARQHQRIPGRPTRAAARVIVGDKDVAAPQVQVARRNRPRPPIRPARIRCRLVVARCRRHDRVAVDVGRSRRHLVDLHLVSPIGRRRCSALRINVRRCLALHRRRPNLHPEDNVTDLGLCQRIHAHVILLAIIR